MLLAANTTFHLTAVNNATNGANGLRALATKNSLTITGAVPVHAGSVDKDPDSGP
jgi:hypothetical protein